MRAWPLLGAVLLGMTLCGSASAQSSTLLFDRNYGSTIGNQGNIPPNTSLTGSALGRSFSLRDLFSRFPGISPRPSVGNTPTVPDPNTPAYLEGFGFRRIGR